MKTYPSIPHINKIFKKHNGQHCYAFHKYDGSNLRFEWSISRGFYKFGTRHRLFDSSDDMFGNAIELFQDTISVTLSPILKSQYSIYGRAIVFCEYFGPNSFTGSHLSNDPKTLILFDVNIYKYGFIPPKAFIDTFGNLEYCAKSHYNCFLTKELILDIQLDANEDYEGIVFKGGATPNKIWRGKVKTKGWLTKLKSVYQNGWEKYV